MGGGVGADGFFLFVRDEEGEAAGVGPAGFEHDHPDVRIFTQAGGEHTARCSGSDDHVVG